MLAKPLSHLKTLKSSHNKDVKILLHYQNFLYISKIIWTEFISKYHNNLLTGYFDINKIQKLVAQKYH